MKTVFISYLQSEADKEKLNQLIQLLEENNIRVIIDKRNLKIGDDLPLFMEKNLVESNFIIVILTPGYKKRADDRKGGVGYEASIMAASLSKKEAGENFSLLLLRHTEMTLYQCFYLLNLHQIYLMI